jgi:small subunit ribosomal protein S4e
LGKKGPTRHLKRHKSPAFWTIPRKAGKWAVRSSPGPHSIQSSIPLNVILRDTLKHASTSKEAKILIKAGKLVVDGKIRVDERFPVGLMDVLHLPDSDENYRVLPDHGGRLKFHPISKEETSFKLCRIIGKTTLQGRITQLNLHDGKNINVDSDADNFSVNDVLKVKIPDLEIQDHIEFREMTQVIIIGGRSQGANGMLIGLGPEPGWKKTATIRTQDGEDIRTLAGYVFVIGEKEPVISLKGALE